MGIQVAPRISFRQMHDMGLGKSLSYVFVLAYSASQIIVLFLLWYSSCFDVKCWFHTFPKRCSHISMGVLILLDHWGCHVNSFQPACFSSSGSDHFNIREINSKFSQRCLFHPSPSCLCFPTLPPFFLQGLRFLNQVSIYSCEVSSLFSINVLIRWFSGRY